MTANVLCMTHMQLTPSPPAKLQYELQNYYSHTVSLACNKLISHLYLLILTKFAHRTHIGCVHTGCVLIGFINCHLDPHSTNLSPSLGLLICVMVLMICAIMQLQEARNGNNQLCFHLLYLKWMLTAESRPVSIFMRLDSNGELRKE